jgi:hypothetical protein
MLVNDIFCFPSHSDSKWTFFIRLLWFFFTRPLLCGNFEFLICSCILHSAGLCGVFYFTLQLRTALARSVQAEPCFASLLTSWLQLWIAVAHSVQAEPCYASLLTSRLQLLGAVTHSVQAEPCYASLLTSRLQLWRAVTHSVQAEPCLLLFWLVVTALSNDGSFKFKLSFASLLASWFHFWTALIHCVQPELVLFYFWFCGFELYPWFILSKRSLVLLFCWSNG